MRVLDLFSGIKMAATASRRGHNASCPIGHDMWDRESKPYPMSCSSTNATHHSVGVPAYAQCPRRGPHHRIDIYAARPGAAHRTVSDCYQGRACRATSYGIRSIWWGFSHRIWSGFPARFLPNKRLNSAICWRLNAMLFRSVRHIGDSAAPTTSPPSFAASGILPCSRQSRIFAKLCRSKRSAAKPAML